MNRSAIGIGILCAALTVLTVVSHWWDSGRSRFFADGIRIPARAHWISQVREPISGNGEATCTFVVSVPGSETKLISFFDRELGRRGWLTDELDKERLIYWLGGRRLRIVLRSRTGEGRVVATLTLRPCEER